MNIRIPETNKKTCVCSTPTDDGVKLPIIDIANPAFAPGLSDDDLVANLVAIRKGTPDDFVMTGSLRKTPGKGGPAPS
jgi:hypothetical protein